MGSLLSIVFIFDGAWLLFSDVFDGHNIYLKSPRIENDLSGACSMDKPSAIEISVKLM